MLKIGERQLNDRRLHKLLDVLPFYQPGVPLNTPILSLAATSSLPTTRSVQLHRSIHHFRWWLSLSKTINEWYLLVNANTSYNILLGHSINRLKAIVSTPHLAMKFPSVIGDIATVHVDQKTARECYVASIKVEPTRRLYTKTLNDQSPSRRERSPETRSRGQNFRRHLVALVDLDLWLDDPQMEASEDLQPIFLRNNDRKTYMGTLLKSDDRKVISTTLVKNANLFAWTTAACPG